MPPVVVGTSGDIDCLGRTDQSQEFLKNLLSIRLGVGRNLATSATTTDPGQRNRKGTNTEEVRQ